VLQRPNWRPKTAATYARALPPTHAKNPRPSTAQRTRPHGRHIKEGALPTERPRLRRWGLMYLTLGQMLMKAHVHGIFLVESMH